MILTCLSVITFDIMFSMIAATAQTLKQELKLKKLIRSSTYYNSACI